MNPADKIPRPLAPELIEKPWSGREAWRVFGIIAEFVEATERLSSIRPAVSIFGSARVLASHPYYQLTEEITRQLSDAGFTVMSGGGPGLMEAANKGAFHGRSLSVGLNIQLPHEQSEQSRTRTSVRLPAFLRAQGHVRQVRLRLRRHAGRLRHAGRADGGADLVQTGKIRRMPIILVHEPFWRGHDRLDPHHAGGRRR